MGDFNWITPHFLAFASPQHKPTAPIPASSPQYAALPSNSFEIFAAQIPLPFKNVLAHFASRNVGLVVRLNSELYCPSYFTALGMNHMDMIFEDGTCPPLPLVRRFIKLAHEMITVKNKAIAVHCKAGLGRTGCLIGAYLIYRHGFTANEIIAFMRFMRPGMVVGPQQHWLHLNQGSFREWWFEDSMKEKLALTAPATPAKVNPSPGVVTNGQTATPPNPNQSKRAALGEIDHNEGSVGYNEENLPVPTPGQPRKAHRKDSRHHPYARTVSASIGLENELEKSSTERSTRRTRQQSEDRSVSEEDDQLQMLAKKRQSKSPMSPTRSISHSAAMSNQKVGHGIYEDPDCDEPSPNRPKTPSTVKSGFGSTKVRASPRRATDSKSETRGVRKVSGRIGSASGSTKVK